MSGVSNSFTTSYTPILLFDRFNSIYRIIAIGFRVCSVRYVQFDDNVRHVFHSVVVPGSHFEFHQPLHTPLHATIQLQYGIQTPK